MVKTKTTKLFAGRDAGHYTLPEEVLAARERVDTFARATWPVPSWPDALAALQEAVRAVATGVPLDPRAVEAAVAANAGHDVFGTHIPLARRLAAEELAEDLDLVVADRQEQIIVDHLRPALAETMQTVEAAAKAAPPEVLLAGDTLLLSAKEPVRKAALALDGAAIRYHAIRTGFGVLRQLGDRPERDAADYFSEIQNLNELWPGHRSKVPEHRPPWPTDPRGRMLWLHTAGATPWLPLASEQDALFMTTYGDEAEQRATVSRQWSEFARGY